MQWSATVQCARTHTLVESSICVQRFVYVCDFTVLDLSIRLFNHAFVLESTDGVIQTHTPTLPQ